MQTPLPPTPPTPAPPDWHFLVNICNCFSRVIQRLWVWPYGRNLCKKLDTRNVGVDCWKRARSHKDVIKPQGCMRTGWTGTQLLVTSQVKSLTEWSIHATRIDSEDCKVSRLVTMLKWQLNDWQSNFNVSPSDCSKKIVTENNILWTQRQTWLMIKKLRHYISEPTKGQIKNFNIARHQRSMTAVHDWPRHEMYPLASGKEKKGLRSSIWVAK